jgi:hypothetical protein
MTLGMKLFPGGDLAGHASLGQAVVSVQTILLGLFLLGRT